SDASPNRPRSRPAFPRCSSDRYLILKEGRAVRARLPEKGPLRKGRRLKGRANHPRPSAPGPPRPAQEPVGLTALPTVLKVLLAFWPSVVMAAMHTTMIRASITAYSTAVGPSSLFRKLTKFLVRLRILDLQTSGGHGNGYGIFSRLWAGSP